MEMTKIVCPKCGRDVKLDAASRSGRCSLCNLSYSLGGAVSLGENAEPPQSVAESGATAAAAAPWHKAGITPLHALQGRAGASAPSSAPAAVAAPVGSSAVGAAAVGAAAGAATAAALSKSGAAEGQSAPTAQSAPTVGQGTVPAVSAPAAQTAPASVPAPAAAPTPVAASANETASAPAVQAASASAEPTAPATQTAGAPVVQSAPASASAPAVQASAVQTSAEPKKAKKLTRKERKALEKQEKARAKAERKQKGAKSAASATEQAAPETASPAMTAAAVAAPVAAAVLTTQTVSQTTKTVKKKKLTRKEKKALEKQERARAKAERKQGKGRGTPAAPVTPDGMTAVYVPVGSTLTYLPAEDPATAKGKKDKKLSRSEQRKAKKAEKAARAQAKAEKAEAKLARKAEKADAKQAKQAKREAKRAKRAGTSVVAVPVSGPAYAEQTAPVAERQVQMTSYRTPRSERNVSTRIAKTDQRLVSRRSENIDRASLEKKLRRADRALAKRKWKKADSLYDDVLLADPENAEAYLGKSLVSKRVTSLRALGERTDLPNDKYFLLALHHSDGSLRRRLDSCADASTKAKLVESKRELIDSETRRRALDRITESRLDEINRRAREAEEQSLGEGEELERARHRRISRALDKGDRQRRHGNWKKAKKAYRAALAEDGECSEAYVGLLLSDLRLRNERDLPRYGKDFESNENFLLAVHFGSRATRQRLESALREVQQRNGLRPVRASSRPQYAEEQTASFAPAAAASEQTPAPVVVLPTDIASGTELSRVHRDLGGRIETLELAAREKDVTISHLSALESRLTAAERNALESRVHAAESAAIDARNYAFDKAELTARLSAAQVELAHLRGTLGGPYGDEKTTVYGAVITTGREDVPRLLKDANKLLRKRKFERAESTFREALRLDPTCSEGYLGCLLCELRLTKASMLESHDISFSDRENFALAVRFASPDKADVLNGYAAKTDARVSKNRKKREKSEESNLRRQQADRLADREAIVLSEAARRIEANTVVGLKISQREQDARVDAIRELMARKKYTRAIQRTEELIALDPSLADAYLLRLMCSVPCRKPKGLVRFEGDLRQSPDYILACRFGTRRTKRMLARYAAKCDKRRAGVGAVDERKQKKLDEQEASSVKQDRLGFNRQSGDLAEAQRADMDVISARKAIARSRMIPPHVDKKLLAKGNRALRRRKWLKANQCFDTVISKDAANEEAFLGKLLASVPARSVRELSGAKASFSTNRYYIVLQHIATPALKAKLAAAAKKVDARLNRGEEEYERMTEKRVMNRRLRLTERRLRDSEARNRKLEVETERLRKNKTYEEVYGSFRYGEPSADGVARTGRFSGVAVVAFLIGAAVVTAFSIGVAVLFAKFGGDLSAFLAALGLG